MTDLIQRRGAVGACDEYRRRWLRAPRIPRRWTRLCRVPPTDSPSRTISTPAGALSTAARRGSPSTMSVATPGQRERWQHGSGRRRGRCDQRRSAQQRRLACSPASPGIETDRVPACDSSLRPQTYVQAVGQFLDVRSSVGLPRRRRRGSRSRARDVFRRRRHEIRRDERARRHDRIELPGHGEERLILTFRLMRTAG